MAWDYETSKKRVEAHRDAMPEIEVKKLERDADLEALLSETVCREIEGAHVYIEIANFSRFITDAEDDDEAKVLLRRIHIYQRQLAWIVEYVLDGVRVHFQGARLHALFYRPIADAEALAAKAVLLMVLVRDFLRYVYNPAFPEYDNNLIATGGADFGVVIGTQNGMRGDRELLFVGDAANQAAKIMDGGMRITPRLYALLPEELQAICEPVDANKTLYRLDIVTKDDVVELAAGQGITWDREEMGERVTADLDQFGIDDIEIGGAEELIDFDMLSLFRNKRVIAASLFADIVGYTKFIGGCADDATKERAIQALHLTRREFSRVATQDFNAIRVQFQGDRMQALVHLPADDAGRIAKKATDIAVALQSSIEVVKEVFAGIGSLHLAIGIDMGTVLATRLGPRGHRDRIVLGASVMEAAANEERTSTRDIGVSKAIYDELSEEIKPYFSWSATAKCYVANGLTVSALELKKKQAAYAGAASVFVSRSSSGISVSREEVPSGREIKPARSFAG